MITFIHPYAFLWLFLALPLLLFYLWRARRPQTQVVTGALWKRAIPLLHPRRAWQKQRWMVSLFTQLAVLIVVVTALAEPCWRRPQRVVLVLDATESMSVRDSGGVPRFEAAQEKARELVQNMGYNDSLAVIVVGENIQIHSRMSHNREQILASFASLPSAGGNAPVDEAVSMGRSLITAGTGGKFDSKINHVILISDGCFPLSARVLKDEAVRWIPVGDSIGNVQLETLCAERRIPEKPESAEIFASLRNFAQKSVAGSLILTWEGQTQAQEIPVEIPALDAGGLFTYTLPVTEPSAKEIHAEFRPKNPADDALSSDNSASVQLSEAFSYSVTLVTPPEQKNTLLEKTVAALPSVQLQEELPTEPYTTLENGVKQFHIVIYDRTLPAAGVKTGADSGSVSGADSGSGSYALYFAPPESTAFWTRGETVRDYVIMPWMDGLKSGISTAGIGFTTAHAFTPRVPAQSWLFSQSALEVNENRNVSEEDENFAKQARTVEMTELAWGLEPENAPRNVLAACDLTQSDWILADDFPRFLQYAFDWMIHTPASDERLARGLESGWNPGNGFSDSNLNIPEAPEKIFRFPGEDLIPMWTLLILIVSGALAAEWYLYQRRWLE